MKRPIAILGGMGPEASASLYNIMIQQAVKDFHAVNNDDFPEIDLYSLPVPDFISSDEKKNDALEILKRKVEQIKALNPLCYTLACNTAHVLIEQLEEVAKPIPFVSIIDEVIKNVNNDNVKKVGIFGTPSTVKSRIYQNALDSKKIEFISPNDEQINDLESIIRNVISGRLLDEDTKTLEKIALQIHSSTLKFSFLYITKH